MTEQEIVRALITAGAVVLGFVLGQVSEWVKTRKASHRKECSIKKLISLEVNQNISHVKYNWTKVIESHGTWETEDGKFMFTQLVKAAANTPFPMLSSNAWESNIGEIKRVATS